MARPRVALQTKTVVQQQAVPAARARAAPRVTLLVAQRVRAPGSRAALRAALARIRLAAHPARTTAPRMALTLLPNRPRMRLMQHVTLPGAPCYRWHWASSPRC